MPEYGYGIKFLNSLYKVDYIDIASASNSRAIFMFAFKIDTWPNKYQYLFSSEMKNRCVYLKGANLIIQGSKSQDKTVAVKYR